MTGALHPASGGRLLVIASRSDAAAVIAEQSRRPIVALLTWNDGSADLGVVELAVSALLDAGCEYFVCFGAASERLHDWIDDLVVSRSTAATVVTTWHDDETASDVAEFFFDVAGNTEGALLVALLGPGDADLAAELARRADAR